MTPLNHSINIKLSNNGKPNRDSIFLAIAEVLSLRSSCQRAKVGAVITRNNRIVGTGYNGTLKPSCQGICDPSHKCTHAVHAEANAISSSAFFGTSLEGCTLYCTMSPCYECAKLIIQSGIIRVVYKEAYRLKDGIDLLEEHGVVTIHEG